MARTLKFGIIGCGRIFPKHFEAIAKALEDTEIAAVCDVIEERAKKAGATAKVPHYLDYHEMMRKHPEIDIVSILTPSGMHAPQVIELAPYGKHLIVEKPMALNIPEAEEMIEVCARRGIRLFVVKQNRFNLPVLKLREALQSGRFGKLATGSVRVRWYRTQKYYDQDAWRGTWGLDGGVIANQASHHIDLLTWMMGDVESVFAYTATRLVNIEADDTAVAVLKFRNGALGVVEATTATRPVDLEGSLSILGEGGTVVIGGFAVNQMVTWNFANPLPDDADVLANFKENPPNVYGFGHNRYLSEVVDAVRKNQGGAGIVDGIEGLKSLVLINAMYESMETGREVNLHFTARNSRLGRPLKVAGAS